MFRYYSILRPVSIGTYPKPLLAKIIENYDSGKTFCEEIKREAYGYVEYEEQLDPKEAESYDLIPAWLREYYCVTSSYDDNGRTVAAITDIRWAEKRPKGDFHETRKKDIYIDWFDNPKDAEEYVMNVRRECEPYSRNKNKKLVINRE